MKKLVSVILALAILVCTAVCFTSCKTTEEYTVGICQLMQHEALDEATRGFKEGLTAALEKEGKTVKFDEQMAQGDSTICTTIINSFVTNDVDLIMANATPALQSAYNATTKIPIVGTSITEYGVALGIENFSGTVGANVTGTSDLASLATQAELLVETLDLEEGSKIGIIYCASEPNSAYQVANIKTMLEDKGMVCTVNPFNDSNDLPSIAANVASTSDAIFLPNDNTVVSNAALIYSACSPLDVPVFTGDTGSLKICGYATLSASYYNIGYEAGEMAADILLGNKNIEEMPIGYDPNPKKYYNKAICEELGIDIAKLEALGFEEIK